MISILTSQETMSVFLAGILSIGIAKMAKRCDYYLEESLKIDDNHHKIINMYSGHKKHNIDVYLKPPINLLSFLFSSKNRRYNINTY